LSYYVPGKNRVVVPPVTPKGRGGSRTQNLMIILKILRICNVNSKINLKITVKLKIFNHFVSLFMDLPVQRVKNMLSNYSRSAELPVYSKYYKVPLRENMVQPALDHGSNWLKAGFGPWSR
jgi:hypothetical protein